MTTGFPERCPVPVRSTVLPLCDRFAVMTADLGAALLMQSTKLRTITAQNPNTGWTVTHDKCPRVSHLLRSTHLVELPRLPNEIRGQMSLAGPRPERPHFTLLKS